MNQKKDLSYKKNGFTLVELMIVVAILAIIAAIAFPSYRRYVLEVNRKAAIAYMNDLGQSLERQYTNLNGTYGTAPTITNPKGYIVAVVIPAGGQTFTITAAPDTGATDNNVGQDDDKCGTLTINSNGGREAKKDGTVVTGCFR
ncbi:MAG: hypothetical protein CSA44_03160 [Gammaproteobacteria bacterium]|nr:MAG: hypothetical protein CSA44_03160 [Gammaproteobacteria bacterium]